MILGRLFPFLPLLLVGSALAAQPAEPPFTSAIKAFAENFKPGGQDLTGQVRPLSPLESLRRMHPAEGYTLQLVASEPAIRQPIDLCFDERGRLWVVQLIQFPFPAGLTVTGYDQYLRAEFDQMPPPPPRHFRGADKITILEDRDGDGRYETAKDFVSGLSLTTSLALGNGGVWVLQPPYLLFYPDRNGDDIPDGDPEVRLTGFGLEDTSSLATSLHFGPDGWLYGATGSTTNLDIQGIRLRGQGIWRYHPGTKVFEVFAEGGGNTMSLEFDKYGRAYSGTNYGATRGLHYVQGATYMKVWSKHGPALNPFAYGFFEHMAHEGYAPRFPQAFLFYEGGAMPALEGEIVVGMALTNRIQSSRVFPDTSTFRTVDDPPLVTSEDPAFRPVNLELGPDGCIYIADWYDPRITNLNPYDTWDKADGRIYRLAPKDAPPPARVDLRQRATADLIPLLSHANRWYREQARGLLAERPEPIGPKLKAMLAEGREPALEALWVLNLRGELDFAELRRALGSPNEHVRRWAVRLLGDRNSVDEATQAALAALAGTESAVEVRSQLASTSKRLPAGQALPILRRLLARDEDATDKHIPLLLWWAIESKADTGREELLALLRDPSIWHTKIFSRYIAERLGRRYAADQGPGKYYTLTEGVYSDWRIDRVTDHLRRNLELCARLLAAAPESGDADRVITGMAQGLTGGVVASVPRTLQELLTHFWQTRAHSVTLVTLAARLGQPGAMAEAVALAKAESTPPAERAALLDLFGATAAPEALPVVVERLRREKNDAQRGKLLEALNGFDQPAAAEAMLDAYPTLGPRLQNVAQRLLSAKPAWALVMMQRMAEGTFDPGVLASTQVTAIRAHRNPQLDALLASYQEKKSSDPADRQAQELFDRGRTLYRLHCAACHQENGQGLLQLAPSLVASPWVQVGEAAMVRIVLHGKENPGGRGLIMPSLKQLGDEQIAAILTYVRRDFGNRPGRITPTAVAEIRAATAGREKPWSDPELERFKP